MSGNPDNLLSPGMFAEPDTSNPEYARVLGSQLATRAAANLLWRGAKGVAGDAWDLIKAPGQILSGEKTPYTGREDSVDPAGYAAHLAGYGMGGGALLAPASKASMFGGVMAETARIRPEELYGIANPTGSRTLEEAFILNKRGATPDEIFHNTGWFQGADNQWRFNINDEKAELKLGNLRENRWMPSDSSKVIYGPKFTFGKSPQTLGDIFDHPELFKAYPDLKDIEVRSMPLGDIGSVKGAYDHNKNIMYLDAADPGDLKSTIIHELQHGIQGREGFARGGSPGEFLSPTYNKELSDVMKWQSDAENDIRGMGVDPHNVMKVHGFGYYDNPSVYGLGPEQIEAVNSLPQHIVNGYRDAVQLKKIYDAEGAIAHEHYMNLAGEQEARAAQMQTHMGRWDLMPSQMQDIRGYEWSGKPVIKENMPYEKQIVVPPSHPFAPGGLRNFVPAKPPTNELMP